MLESFNKHFVNYDLRVETFFEKDEAPKNGGGGGGEGGGGFDFEISDIGTSVHMY